TTDENRSWQDKSCQFRYFYLWYLCNPWLHGHCLVWHGEMTMPALVIDDSRAVRIIIGNILRDIGMHVLEAGNGLEALEQMQRNPDIELLLVDWNMPIMNGFDFLRAVRSQRAYDAVRILMVTSEAQVEQVTKA